MKSTKELSGSSDDLIIIEPGMGEAIPYRNSVITRKVFSTQAAGLWPCGELREAPGAEVSVVVL